MRASPRLRAARTIAMWELSNRTPFAAERTFARDRHGAEMLLVVVKATFAIGIDGRLQVADEQVPVARTPRHAGEPGRSSLLHDTDFTPPKRATDVLVVGHAHAVGGRPTIAVEARVRVGVRDKRILVLGDRLWDRRMTGWGLTDPAAFTRMPLIYERAFGGTDRAHTSDSDSDGDTVTYDANPVGVGFARSVADLAGRAAPNLEDPSDRLHAPEHRPRPMCFGPIAAEWPERRRLAGTYDARWQRERRPLVPDDFDDAFWQSAPPDQQARLEGGEPVELSGLAARGVIRFELPHIRPSLRTRIGRKRVEHAASLHTVIFEPDEDRVVLVLVSALPCHQDLHSLERTEVEAA